MHISFCISTLDVGGAERQLVQLMTHLPRPQYEPALIVLGSPPPPHREMLLREVQQHRIPIEFLKARRPWDAWRTVRALSSCLAELRPQILQCFLAHANIAGSLAGRHAQVPQVVSGIRVADLRWNLHRRLARLTESGIARHVCVSDSVADFAIHRMRLNPAKIRVIPNGVDAQRFLHAQPIAPADLQLPPHRRWLVYVGRLDPQKRLTWLIDRLPEITRQLPEHDLLIAGVGPQQAALRRQALRRGVANRVHWIGWQADIAPVLAASEILLLTSRWEGMPNVLLEAMAAGRPVVATQAHGVAEILGADPHRQLVAPDDASGFIARVVQIARDPDQAARIGTSNQSRVLDDFSVQRMVDRYQRVYAELCGDVTIRTQQP